MVSRNRQNAFASIETILYVFLGHILSVLFVEIDRKFLRILKLTIFGLKMHFYYHHRNRQKVLANIETPFGLVLPIENCTHHELSRNRQKVLANIEMLNRLGQSNSFHQYGQVEIDRTLTQAKTTRFADSPIRPLPTINQ